MIILSTSMQSKKLIILNILDILRKYSDENHRLSQRDIEDILLKKYDMTVERKAIKRNIIKIDSKTSNRLYPFFIFSLLNSLVKIY